MKRWKFLEKKKEIIFTVLYKTNIKRKSIVGKKDKRRFENLVYR